MLLYFHIMYTIISIGLISVLFIRVASVSTGTVKGNKKQNKFLYLLVLYGVVVSLLFNVKLPIFNSGGSDAIVKFHEESRLSGLLLQSFSLPVMGCIALLLNGKKSKLLYILCAFFLIAAGKKAGILTGIHFMTLFVVMYGCSPKYLMKLLPLLFVIGFGFASLQLLRSTPIESIKIIEFLNNIEAFWRIIFISASLFLIQLYEWGGYEFLLTYKISENAFEYFFNPFLKVLDAGGVDKMLGPFLNYKLFGSNIPNGSNMTLPIELFALGGLAPMFLGSIISVIFFVFGFIFLIRDKTMTPLKLILFGTFFKFYLFIYPDIVNGYIFLFFDLIIIFLLYVGLSLFNLWSKKV